MLHIQKSFLYGTLQYKHKKTKMDTIELVKENSDSVEISKTSKGEFSWKIKVYGDSKTSEGRKEIVSRLDGLKAHAEALAK